jgi:iron complex transport system ATP-binding protein
MSNVHQKPAALHVSALSVTAGTDLLLNNIGFSLAAGGRLAVVGPNGAGKSTLLRTLYGRVRPETGQILLNGSPLERMPLAERARHIAVVAQSDIPDARLTVEDYVALGRLPFQGWRAAGDDRHLVGRMLERFALEPLRSRLMGSLSGGERQRAALARALTQQPGLLLLDEPTNHLDLRTRADLLGLVRDLGITVVAVLHELAMAAEFADQIVVLQAGRCVAGGSPESALTPQVIRNVFAVESFTLENPLNGRRMMVFDPSLS